MEQVEERLVTVQNMFVPVTFFCNASQKSGTMDEFMLDASLRLAVTVCWCLP